MTRKDFIRIAHALHAARPASYTVKATSLDLSTPEKLEAARLEVAKCQAWKAAVREVGTALADTNPRFDFTTFWQAAGL